MEKVSRQAGSAWSVTDMEIKPEQLSSIISKANIALLLTEVGQEANSNYPARVLHMKEFSVQLLNHGE
ncbi:hypothetical protein [Microvirga sp. P5_D2]